MSDGRSREKPGEGQAGGKETPQGQGQGWAVRARLAPLPQGAVAIIMPIKMSKFKM